MSAYLGMPPDIAPSLSFPLPLGFQGCIRQGTCQLNLTAYPISSDTPMCQPLVLKREAQQPEMAV